MTRATRRTTSAPASNGVRSGPATADDLAAANLLYRDPGLHDHLQGLPTQDIDVVRHAVDTWAPGAATLLDVGCGTGTLVAAMSYRLHGLGVDLQPQQVAHARRAHPKCEFQVVELCSLDLESTFDVVTCLGNVLAYLHEPDQLDAAIAAIAQHSRTDSLLIINTLIAPPPPGPARAGKVSTPDGEAVVTVQNHWDDAAQMATMARRWTFPGNRIETDVVRRRVHTIDSLTKSLASHGFWLRGTFDTLATRNRPPRGPAAYLVAQAHDNPRGRGPDPR